MEKFEYVCYQNIIYDYMGLKIMGNWKKKKNLIYDSIITVEFLPYIVQIAQSNMWVEVFL